jgi:hypothetical protein
MKGFADYATNRDLVEFIIDNNIDVEKFCESVIAMHTENENINEAVYNEFISSLARGLSGVVGGALGMGKDAVVGAKNAVVGAKNAVMGAAQAAGKYVGDKYETGRRAEAIKQVNDRIKGLENALVSLGLDKSGVSDFLGKINAHLQNAVKSGQIGSVKSGAEVRQAEKQRQLSGGHAAWDAVGNTMAARARGVDRYRQEQGKQAEPASV